MVSSIGMCPRKVGFSVDSPLEGEGFEPSVPRSRERPSGAKSDLRRTTGAEAYVQTE